MKTKVLDNIITSDELFFMYNQIISTPMWNVEGISSCFEEESWKKKYNRAPNLSVKKHKDVVEHYAFYLWGKTIAYRIKERLTKEKIPGAGNSLLSTSTTGALASGIKLATCIF